MTCYHPIKAYRAINKKTDNGKSVICFNHSDVSDCPFETLLLPCSNCSGCRMDRSKSWAIRCIHESSLYENNCFITLTFSDDTINSRGTLVKSDFQNFMKRLRKRFSGIQPVSKITHEVYSMKDLEFMEMDGTAQNDDLHYPIRFFHAGEYGDKYTRPHHHACLFNFDFTDKVLIESRGTNHYYRSAELEKLWPFGYSMVGHVTVDSAAYVARYILKKMNGKLADDYYKRYDLQTGEEYQLQPEYTTMSRRPGIAASWFKKNPSSVYPKDYVTSGGKSFKSPRFYDNMYELSHPEEFLKIKNKRKLDCLHNSDENTPARLRVREKVLQSKLTRLVRTYENGDEDLCCL